MLIPIITNELHFSDITETTVILEWYREPREPNPSKEELALCPERFRCYSCLRLRGKKHHFGGLVLDRRICRECYPYLDEADVGAMIAFDLYHGFNVD